MNESLRSDAMKMWEYGATEVLKKIWHAKDLNCGVKLSYLDVCALYYASKNEKEKEMKVICGEIEKEIANCICSMGDYDDLVWLDKKVKLAADRIRALFTGVVTDEYSFLAAKIREAMEKKSERD